MLRSLARIGHRAAIASVASHGRALSTVAANTIKLTFVDQAGNRATVPARVGQSILDVAVLHKVDLEGPCGGGGSPTEIPSSFNAVLPEQTKEETSGLADIWEDEVSKTSRLACMITLDKRHDGLIVYIPDAPPTNVI